MPRNMSFMLTVDAVREQRKTVTRRNGWLHLQLGEIVNACVKCQGIKKGDSIDRICQIRIEGTRREPLCSILDEPNGTELEGLPDLSPQEFVRFYCEANPGTDPDDEITRIEFSYV